MNSPIRFAALGALLVLSIPSLAAPCVGFTDIDDTNPFCPNVEWLRNRAVTLGCTTTSEYCPSAAVSRLAMAAFLNRLGRALSPTKLYGESNGDALDLDAPPAVVCPTETIPLVDYPRAAKAGAVMSANFAGTGTVALKLVVSTDGGASWSAMHSHAASAGGANRWVNAAVWKGDYPVAPGASYRFGLHASRTGSGSGDAGAWNCQLEVVVTSRTGAASPL